jgi:hypothetical protein
MLLELSAGHPVKSELAEEYDQSVGQRAYDQKIKAFHFSKRQKEKWSGSLYGARNRKQVPILGAIWKLHTIWQYLKAPSI